MWLSEIHASLLLYIRIQEYSKDEVRPWIRSCSRLEGQGSLSWGSWISSQFSWSLFLIRTSCSSSRYDSPISNARAVSLACLNGGIDVWACIRMEEGFHLTERTEGRIESLEKTEHSGTDMLSGILKDLIHTSGVMSTWMGVESCLPTLTLWAYQVTGQLWFENRNCSGVTLCSCLP